MKKASNKQPKTKRRVYTIQKNTKVLTTKVSKHLTLTTSRGFVPCFVWVGWGYVLLRISGRVSNFPGALQASGCWGMGRPNHPCPSLFGPVHLDPPALICMSIVQGGPSIDRMRPNPLSSTEPAPPKASRGRTLLLVIGGLIVVGYSHHSCCSCWRARRWWPRQQRPLVGQGRPMKRRTRPSHSPPCDRSRPFLFILYAVEP